jgi:hypothetical protein
VSVVFFFFFSFATLLTLASLQDKTFTVRLAELGRIVDAHGPMVEANERPEQMLKLLGGLAKYMPDMNVSPELLVSGRDC